MPYPMNQFAPTYFQGVNTMPVSVAGYEPKPYDYVYSPPTGALTANQELTDSLAIQTDADFDAFAFYIAKATGEFEVKFVDSTGYELSNAFLNSGSISTDSEDPTVWSPAVPLPAGGKLQIFINDLSGAGNTVQLVFKGIKKFRPQIGV